MKVSRQTLRAYQVACLANVHVAEDERTLAHLALGLAGEAGEAADQIKKGQYLGRDLDVPKLVSELGDTLFYLAAMAGSLGYGLEEIILINAEKLADRYPDGPFGLFLDEVGR